MRVLHPPAVIAGGEIRFRGEMCSRWTESNWKHFRWRDVSMVFQSAMNALNPVMTIGDQIIDAIHAHERRRIKRGHANARPTCSTLVGIESIRLDSYPHELSGGMRQRAVIAIALALNPPLMIMDEPTTALDVVVQKEIMQQIEELKEQLGFSILFITHDLSLHGRILDRIAIMYAGEIVEMAPPAISSMTAASLHPGADELVPVAEPGEKRP